MGGISQGARDGGVNMPMDGRYITRSQGRRCEYAHGWEDRYMLLGNCSCVALITYFHVGIGNCSCVALITYFHVGIGNCSCVALITNFHVGIGNSSCIALITHFHVGIGNSSCIALIPYVLYKCVALISYVHVTMQYLHFHHPWWLYITMSMEDGSR
jgi:hypothetical protein